MRINLKQLCCHLLFKILMIYNQIAVNMHVHVACHVEVLNDENLECF